eukprot:Partr_v1_DN28825_c2_g1_i6_m34316 putative carbamoylphosphate synthase
MFELNYSVDKIHELTSIDKWFLHKLKNIGDIRSQIITTDSFSPTLLQDAKKAGFSDLEIANLSQQSEDQVRALRKSFGIVPFVKQIDTLAGEVPASTNYLYTTYNASTDDVLFDENGVMVLGSGTYRIGSSVEFDWCAVSSSDALRKHGKRTILVNFNPETVSTDYDQADRLYFEELSYERVMDIYERENAESIVGCMGGQIPQNIALRLHEGGVKLLGTSPLKIDMAENRSVFSNILDQEGIDQPTWKSLDSADDALTFAKDVGYPCLIRPSYVLSGAAMAVVSSENELKDSLSRAAVVSPKYPVVISKFIQNSKELDMDCVAQNGELKLHAVSEHVECAGVHSGDATLVLPPYSINKNQMDELEAIAR